MNSTLENVLPKLLEFRAERQWEQFHLPKELAAALSIEASELQELFLWRSGETAEEVKRDARRMPGIRDEVADVLIYLLFLCHDLEIDPGEAVMTKLEKNRVKYPSEEYRGRFREP